MLRTKTFLFLASSLLLSPLARPQQYEQYQARKDIERQKPNRFLLEESSERKDLLQRYYQSLLMERGRAKLPGFAAAEEEELLKQLKATALEGPINPADYIIGPFDVLSINLWSGVPLSFNPFVTPEGTLIIPTVGEIPVAGRSLKDVKEIVAKEVKKQYTKGDVSVTLLSPRVFVVKVAGVVTKPGAYVLSPVDRVDRAIYLANLKAAAVATDTLLPPRTVDAGRLPAYYRDEELKKQQKPSMRNIRLVRTSGDTILVDLIRYFAMGDVAYNPYLRDGDLVIVPNEDLEANSVSILGAVRYPGRFEFHRHDSLSLMFKIANGPLAAADSANAELVRLKPDGLTFEKVSFSVESVLSRQFDMGLQPNDRVFVRWKKNVREEFAVAVKGEVQRPGEYPITRTETKVSDAIAQAGGFTPEAAVAECRIIRKNNSVDPIAKNPDYERLADMRLSGMNREERDYYTYESTIRRDFVSVDFKKLFIEKDMSADVTLRDGDQILVPSRNRSVYVYGQVASPGFVTYLIGADYMDYIEKAGGLSKAADRKNVSVIKAGSKKWLAVDEDSVAVEEGDAIFVGLRPERDIAYYFALARDVLTVATAAATIYFLIDQARR